MKETNDGASPEESMDEMLDHCTPEDFDGHTEFRNLTPEQRLDWLAEAAAFVEQFKGKANS